MNKKQLIAKLSGSLNLSKADAERTFDTITNTILDALKVMISKNCWVWYVQSSQKKS